MRLMMVLAAARLADVDEWALIRELRDERGIVAGEWTEAQVALSRWMLGIDAGEPADLPRGQLIKLISDDQAIRFLTGETEPSRDVADLIAEVTQGAVTPGMWARTTTPPITTFATGLPRPVADRAAEPLPNSVRPPAQLRISDRLGLTRTANGALLVRTPSFVGKIEADDILPLLCGIHTMLGHPTEAARI